MNWLQQDNTPNWTAILATFGGLLTAIGVPIAAYSQLKKGKGDASSLTLDGVFKLVDQLQEEVKNKAAEIVEMDTRHKTTVASYEAQKEAFQRTIASQIEVIQSQAEEMRKLRLGLG